VGREDPLRYYYLPIVGHIFRARLEQALSLLSPPYSSILELGYGSGILLPALAARGKEIHGADRDADPDEVAHAISRYSVNAQLTRQDARVLGYPDGRFDLVVAISLMEHIRDVDTVLKEVSRVLKPGGEFLVGMPQSNILMSFLYRLIGWREASTIHVTDYHTVKACAECYFHLTKEARIPSHAPRWAGLYFTMLFQKR
jgi:ubiquinone/menaquinone biosynthesis C-methylase UbiE